MENFDDEDDIQLSKKERLFLINQYSILEKLNDDPEDTHYADCIEILKNGYKFEYHKLFDSIADPVDREVSSEILDILSMFQALDDSYKGLTDKEGIEEWKVTFTGFDNNTESVYLNYVTFLVDEGKKFSDLLKKRNYNSHAPCLWRYRAMLSRWKELGGFQNPNLMGKEKILKIIGESEQGE